MIKPFHSFAFIFLTYICCSSCAVIPFPLKINYYPTMTGQIVDGPSKLPVADAYISFKYDWGNKIAFSHTDSEGRFTLKTKSEWRYLWLISLLPIDSFPYWFSSLDVRPLNSTEHYKFPIKYSTPTVYIGDTGKKNRRYYCDLGILTLDSLCSSKKLVALAGSNESIPIHKAALVSPKERAGNSIKIKRISNIKSIARLTGPEGSDAMNGTWRVGIGGTDLGHMVNVGEKTFFVFGDTFESSKPIGQNEGAGWRWNTLAWTADSDPRDGITFDGWITDEAGRARTVIEDRRAAPITNIPTGGISVDGRIYLWFMAMKFWGTAEDPCWLAHYSGLAWSDDEGRTFAISEDFKFAEGSNFGMVAVARGADDPALAAAGDAGDGSFIYIWGTPTNRCGGVALARVKPDDIANRAKWEFYAITGPQQLSDMSDKSDRSDESDKTQTNRAARIAPLWSARESDAAIIVPAPAGELSVMYNHWAKSWIMLYITFLPGENPMQHPGRIVLRQAPAPWGPWSEPILVADNARFPGGLYGSYMNPRYVEDDGRVIYFTMSLWDPYDVFWMRAELISE